MVFTEEDIKRQILEQLYWDSRVDSSKVGVIIQEGTITLIGEVHSIHDRDVIEEDCREVSPMTSIQNDITVGTKHAPLNSTDKEIARQVEQLLEQSAGVSNEKILVTVKEGEVIIEGVVSGAEKVTSILSDVEAIDAVHGVVNRLIVVPTKGITDEVIASKLLKDLEKQLKSNSLPLSVSVAQGNVYLRGKQNQVSQMKELELLCQNIDGVKRVHIETLS